MSERSFTANLDDDMLKALDDVLHCRICKGYYSGCVIAACGHNYCGHCIRKRMMNNQDCPFCFEDIREADLRNNKLVDKMVRIYDKLKLRNRLEETQERPNETLRQYKIEIDDTLGPVSNNYEDIAMDDVSSDSQMNNLSLNNDTSTSFNNTSTNFNNTSTSFNNTSTSFNNTSTSFNNTSTSFNNASTSFNNTSASFNSNNDTYSANITENYSNISTDVNTSNNPCNSTEIQASNDIRAIKVSQRKSSVNSKNNDTDISESSKIPKKSNRLSEITNQCENCVELARKLSLLHEQLDLEKEQVFLKDQKIINVREKKNKFKRKYKDLKLLTNGEDYIKMGSSTYIEREKYFSCRTTNYNRFTSDLLDVMFGRETLAKSLIRGIRGSKKSLVLDPIAVKDIQIHVSENFNVCQQEVRRIIRQKLNSADKMCKTEK